MVIENGVISGPSWSGECYPDGIGCFNFYGMKKNQEKIAQICVSTEQRDTFGDLLQRCIRTAIHMKKRNLKEGDIVALCSNNHMNSCVPFIAATFLGCVPVSFDIELNVEDKKQLLSQIKPKILFVIEKCVDVMHKALSALDYQLEYVVYEDDTKYTPFSDFLQEVPGEEDAFKPVKCKNLKDTAVVVFSSGTTGLPKGICLSHYYFTVLKKSAIPRISLAYTSLYWVTGIISVIHGNNIGNTRIVYDTFDPVNVWKWIADYKIESMLIPPYILLQALEKTPETLEISSLRTIMPVGAPVSVQQLSEAKDKLKGINIFLSFGQTESGFISIRLYDEKKGNSVGKLVDGVRVKIVDPETEETLGPNQPGEMRVKSDGILNGYYNQDASVTFDKDGWLKTGDILYYDNDEYFFFVDRLKDVMKFRGYQMVSCMLEDILKSHPAVLNAAVVPKRHEIDGDHPFGFVTLRDGYQHVTADEIMKYYDEKVIDFKRLRGGLKIIKKFPLSPSNKILKRKLMEMFENGLI